MCDSPPNNRVIRQTEKNRLYSLTVCPTSNLTPKVKYSLKLIEYLQVGGIFA